VLPNPVVAARDGLSLQSWRDESLTVGGELNNLAANNSFGRSIGGVHWRSDTADSLRLGEASAISFVACGSGSNRPFRLFQGDLREEQGIGADNRRRGLVIVESGVIGSISLAIDVGQTGARSRRSIAADIFCLIRVINCMITFIWNY
jgi:hypothetical protein